MNLRAIRDTFTRYGLAAGLHDLTKKAAGRAVPLRVLDGLELTRPLTLTARACLARGLLVEARGAGERAPRPGVPVSAAEGAR